MVCVTAEDTVTEEDVASLWDTTFDTISISNEGTSSSGGVVSERGKKSDDCTMSDACISDEATTPDEDKTSEASVSSEDLSSCTKSSLELASVL